MAVDIADILQLVGQQWGLIHYSIVPSSSTDHHCGAIVSMTTSLPLLPVFVLLSCKLFLIFLFFRPAFASLGTLCNNPQQKTAKRIILCPCNLPWKAFLPCTSLQLSSHGTVTFTATSVFDCCNTKSGRRLVSTMLEKNIFLSRSILSCPLASNNILLAVQQLNHPVSQIVCLCFVSDGRILFSSHQPTPRGLCHVATYISPKPALLESWWNICHCPFLFAVFKVWILIALILLLHVCRILECFLEWL